MSAQRINIICDIHDVLIKGLEGVEQELSVKLGIPKDEVMKQLYNRDFQDLWCGKISEAKFFEILLNQTGWNMRSEELIKLIHNNFYEIAGVREIITSLVSKYDTVALSVSCPEWVVITDKNYHISELFKDRVHYSYEIGYTKRQPEAFTWIMEHYKFLPKETLLIDDSTRNLLVAKTLGIKGIKFLNSDQLILDLKNYNINI